MSDTRFYTERKERIGRVLGINPDRRFEYKKGTFKVTKDTYSDTPVIERVCIGKPVHTSFIFELIENKGDIFQNKPFCISKKELYILMSIKAKYVAKSLDSDSVSLYSDKPDGIEVKSGVCYMLQEGYLGSLSTNKFFRDFPSNTCICIDDMEVIDE